jgi:hypothetical protein
MLRFNVFIRRGQGMKQKFLAVALSAAGVLGASGASAQAVISNGTVGLGVDRAGQLNIASTNRSSGTGGGIGGTTNYGLRDIATNREGTAQGCLCEGWGAAVAGTGTTVYANNSSGSSFSPITFASTASTATSTVSSIGGALTVTHSFLPSLSQYLYQVNVSITNTSGAAFTGNTLYRRVMDWDIEPTAFTEYSTIQGTSGAANVLYASNNGFASGDPLSSRTANSSASIVTGDFVDNGPADQGALFDFTFGPLAAGATQTLSIFYGAAPTEALALGALGSVGAEIYSFGQASTDRTGGAATTFIFGFAGVGGTALPDPTAAVPEPASWAMMMVGFGAVGGALRRGKKSARAKALAAA